MSASLARALVELHRMHAIVGINNEIKQLEQSMVALHVGLSVIAVAGSIAIVFRPNEASSAIKNIMTARDGVIRNLEDKRQQLIEKREKLK